jgi:hypothetical protein
MPIPSDKFKQCIFHSDRGMKPTKITISLTEIIPVADNTIQFFFEYRVQTSNVDPINFSRPFLYLLVTQGFFAGLVIGKISEGSAKAGLKHSFIMATAAFLISTGARLLFAN